MIKTLEKLVLIYFIFFSIQETQQNSLEDIFKILSLVNKVVDPKSFIFQLMKLKLLDMEEDFSCTLCKNLVKAVRITIEEKYTPDEIINIISLICSINSNYNYCQSFYGAYGTVLIKNVFSRLTNEDNFCYLLTICPESENTEDTYDYAIRLLKDKPNKKREKIDTTAEQWKMIQITDIHYDSRYIENGTVFCDTPLCCHEPATEYARKKSGKFGYIKDCDTNLNTLKSFVQAAFELNPDFIIWTGDNAEHDNWNQTQEMVYEATRTIKNEIDRVFDHSIPVYPSLGNHEVYPNDLWKPGNTEIFEKLAEIYADYFTEEQAYESFRKFGYYTEKHKDSNLRIIAMNPLYCDIVNYNLISTSHEEAKKEFIWLENVLRQAEKDGEYVYILDHFPINGDFTLDECSKRMRAIFDRFDYIIRGYFSGHTHYDDIVGVRGYFEPRPIININYIAPSLTPNSNLNPSFRQYLIDSNTKNIIDYEQYRLNLTDANENELAEWSLSHKATELFNVTDLTEIEKMCSINVEGDYILKRHSDTDNGKNLMYNKEEILDASCTIQKDSTHDKYICSEKSIFTSDFAYDLLNTISGEWHKDSQ